MKPRHQLAVFGFFFFFYMLTTSREVPWNDASLIYHTAGSIVLRGELGIPIAGAPGQYNYAPHPILPALSQVPGLIIYNWIVARWLIAWSMAKVVTTHLGPAFFGALTCVLFLNATLLLGASRRIAAVGTLMVGLGTSVWVYARSPYSEVVQAGVVMGYVTALLAFWRRPAPRTAFSVGLWGALAVNAKLVFLLALPGGLILCLYRLRHDLSKFLRLALWALVPLAGGGFAILMHNRSRTGVATDSGYSVAVEIFAQPLWEGILGLLASPGKSTLLYAPPLFLSLIGFRTAARKQPIVVWILCLCFVPVFYLYAKYEAWSGDWAWGPRYMVPLMPPLLLPAIVWANEKLRTSERTRLSWTTMALLAASLCGLAVQVLGSAFYWDHFIRISQEARNNWLGNPNRSASKGVPRPNGCDPCYEDFYPFQWLPPFQQIHGHWWLLKNVPAKKTWYEATMNAPWTRYTTSMVPIERSYKQARIDWWALQFWGRFKTATIALLIIFSVGTLGCGTVWWLACRGRQRMQPRGP